MKSIYTRRGIAAVGDRRPPERLFERLARHARILMRKLLTPALPDERKPKRPSWLVEDHSGHQRQSTRPGTEHQRESTRPSSSQRDDVNPYTDA